MITETLSNIQAKLKAPKNQFNAFGKYKYRSLEDILEGLKPLLVEHKSSVTIADEIVEVGSRIYVKATVTLHQGKENISVTAYAREAESRKGMDDSQVTGSASSYARKYACNGLFAIDDTKDADATNQHDKATPAPKKGNQAKLTAPVVDPVAIFDIIQDIKSLDELADHYEKRREAIANAANKAEINALYAERKAQIKETT